MNELTLGFYLSIVRFFPRNHIRSKNAIAKINEQISNYRLTAIKMQGTSLATFCNKQANIMEKRLKSVQ